MLKDLKNRQHKQIFVQNQQQLHKQKSVRLSKSSHKNTLSANTEALWTTV